MRKKTFTEIEAHAGMAKRLVRDLAIEEALQEEIKHTLEHNNQSYGDWCALSGTDKNNNKVKLTVTYDMGWQKISSGRRYDSSRGEEKKQKNMSTQRTLREAQKLWRLLLY